MVLFYIKINKENFICEKYKEKDKILYFFPLNDKVFLLFY